MESKVTALATKQAELPSVRITNDDVKKYLCASATDKEIVMFVKLCQSQNLNPWIKEAYLIKYGTAPATMVVGKDVFTKRAQSSAKFRGFEAGVIVENVDGTVVPQKGSFKKIEQKLVGGWAKVYVENYQVPIEAHVTMEEYSTGQSSWKKMPATMIRKVALVQALREAFPEELGGLYDSAEMGVEIDKPEPKEPTTKPATTKVIKGETVDTSTGEVFTSEPPPFDEEPKEAKKPTALVAEEVVGRFLRLAQYLDTIRPPDFYKHYVTNSKGESPTLQEIAAWRTPKQISWLHGTMKRIAEDINLNDFEKMEAKND